MLYFYLRCLARALTMIISKQLLSNFEAEIAGESKQLEAQPEKVVAYKKTCSHCRHKE